MSRPSLIKHREPGHQDTDRVVTTCACYYRCTVPLTPRFRQSLSFGQPILSFGQPTESSSRDFFSTHILHQTDQSKGRLCILCEASPRVSHHRPERLLEIQSALLAALSQRKPHYEALFARKRKELLFSTHRKLDVSRASEKQLRRSQHT